MRSLPKTVLAMALAMTSGAADAALSLGNEIEVTYFFPAIGAVFDGPVTVVAPDNTLTNFAGVFDIVISDTEISVEATRDFFGVPGAEFNGLFFERTAGDIDFSTFSLDSEASTVVGFGTSDFSAIETELFLNFTELQGQIGDRVVLVAPIPLPATAWMLGLALSLLPTSRFFHSRVR